MAVTRKHTVAHTLKPSQHPYLRGPWTPNFDEIDAEDMTVIGTIPVSYTHLTLPTICSV